MRREVIRFDSEPVKVKLDQHPGSGIETHGDYGTDWRYSLNDGAATMYLPVEGRNALLKSGAQAGDEVAIRRMSKTRWDVEVVSDRPQQQQPQQESRLRPSQESYQQGAISRRSIPAQNVPRQPQPAARMAIAPRPEAHEPDPAPKPNTPKEPSLTYTARQLMACYHDAIETAIESQEYARTRGLGLTVSEASIKSMALTIFINEHKGAALREAS